jgi:hypothetical protein
MWKQNTASLESKLQNSMVGPLLLGSFLSTDQTHRLDSDKDGEDSDERARIDSGSDEDEEQDRPRDGLLIND